MKHLIASCAMLLACVTNILFGASAAAQSDYPNKPVRFIVAYSPGGNGDILTRLLGEQLRHDLGVPIVIENRPGVSGMIGATACKGAEPDGYTFCVFLMEVVTVHSVMFNNVPYQADKDFVPVAFIADGTTLMVVPASSNIYTIQDLARQAKTQPKSTNWGSWGIGSMAHLALSVLEQTFDTEIAHIPYKETPALVNAVRTGEVHGTILGTKLVMGHIENGTIRAIGALGKERLSFMPQLPTFSEQGMPLDAGGWYGVFAPAGTPEHIVTRMNTTINQAMQTVAASGKLDLQAYTVNAMPLAEFAAFVKEQEKVWGDIAVQSGIKLN